jgi:NAD+-dependent protein deacetylase SIR2
VFVIGTSLVVYPFAALPDYTRPSVPRVVLNIDAIENFERPNDVYIAGDCDKSIWSLCQKLGWEKDLQILHTEIGGVSGDWELGASGKKSPAESEETTVGEPGVEDAVAQLTRELEQELRLDKDEDVEVRKTEEKVDKPDESLLRTETRDDDVVVVSKKDEQSSETTKEDSPPKDSKETPTRDPKEKL